LSRGVTVKQLCEKTGISEPQYWRLENLRLAQPSIRLYVNCAIALDVPLEDLLDDELKRWYPFDRSMALQIPRIPTGWRSTVITPGRAIGLPRN
jgi:transcriptional regulator with XRE-family HTH domain